MVLTHGLPASAPARQRPWWHGVVLYTAVVDLALIGLFAATGGAAVWLVLAIIATTATFLLRLARSRRKALSRGGGKTLGR
jgi:O-antigen ligase